MYLLFSMFVGALLGCDGGNKPGRDPSIIKPAQKNNPQPVNPDEPAQEKKPQKITPRVKEIVLEAGGETVKPTHAFSSGQWQFSSGGHQLRVAKDIVTAFRERSDEPLWTAKSEDGGHLEWLAANDGIAFFRGYRVDAQGTFEGYNDRRVRRLDLDTGQWLKSLRFTGERKPRQTPKHVVGVLAKGENIFVLRALTTFIPHGGGGEEVVTAYALTCYRGTEARPIWLERYKAAGERPYTGAYVWPRSLLRAPYAASAVQPLSWMGDSLLVCPEANQPILCVDPDTGTRIWKCERIWEFERGFIGPSVYSYYIGRFGIEERSKEKRREIEQNRREFEKKFSCSVVGGPVAVRIPFKRGADTHSIFVAVIKGPARGYSGYLSECIVYELNNRGAPVSMAKVPQIINGSPFGRTKDGIVWNTHNDGFINISPALRAPHIGMFGGGPDLTTRVAWSRQWTPPRRSAWLVAKRAGNPVAFSETHAFWMPGGGFISKKEEHIYRFPISAVDLKTGLDRMLTLTVPFEGSVPIPKRSYRPTTRSGGARGLHTFEPYLLALTHMRVVGAHLEVTLGMEKWSATVTFDLSKLKLLGR